MSETALHALPVDRITPTPFNRRVFREDADFRALVESIRGLGVLEPILVRTTGDDGYELLAGERRWRAAQAAGLTEIPALVRADLSDAEARVITTTENLHRQDLTPLEEAAGVADLLEAGISQQEIASRLGKSAGWVARRVRLTTLSPAWREAIADPHQALTRWPASHLELVARLEPDAQEALFEDGLFEDGFVPSLAELQQRLARYTALLATAPWKLTDDALLPAAGACSACPKRASCHPALFDDEELPAKGKAKLGDRCLDPACWTAKSDAHLARRVLEVATKHPDVRFVSDGGPKPEVLLPPGAKVENAWSFSRATAKTEGAVPLFMLTGDRRGELSWGLPPTPRVAPPAAAAPPTLGEADGESAAAVDPLAERRAKLELRRLAHALEAVLPAIEAAEPPALDVALRFAVVFGTRHTYDQGATAYRHPAVLETASAIDEDTKKTDDEAEDGRSSWRHSSTSLWGLYAALPAAELPAALWRGVLPVLAKRIRTEISAADRTIRWDEASTLATALGLDPSTFLEAARLAIPEPKAWKSL